MAEEGFHDYTLATNLERLVAQVEQCFRGWMLTGLENISHMPPATGPDKQPTNVVRVSNALKHKLPWREQPYVLTLHPASYSRRLLDAAEASSLMSVGRLALAGGGVGWPLLMPVHDALRDAYCGTAQVGCGSVSSPLRQGRLGMRSADRHRRHVSVAAAGADWLWSAELAAVVLQEGGRLSGVCPQPYGYNPSSSSSSSRGAELDPGSFTTMLSALMTARTAATAAKSLYELAGAEWWAGAMAASKAVQLGGVACTS
ncbi:hypothetical protein OEZ86_013488 [Tetradesmus obliquus]|nr:hypothetical protein OEZ86_013488 [Tetradesmus obliquus]